LEAARRWAFRWATAAARPAAIDGRRCSAQAGRLHETRTTALSRPAGSRRTVHRRPRTRSSGSFAATSAILPFLPRSASSPTPPHRTGHGTAVRSRYAAPAPATRHERERPGPAPNPQAGRPHTLVRVNRTRSRSARQRREPGPQAPPAATRPHLATPAPRPPVRTTTLTTEPRPTPADGRNSSVRVGRSVDVPGAASPWRATARAARSSPCRTVPIPVHSSAFGTSHLPGLAPPVRLPCQGPGLAARPRRKPAEEGAGSAAEEGSGRGALEDALGERGAAGPADRQPQLTGRAAPVGDDEAGLRPVRRRPRHQ